MPAATKKRPLMEPEAGESKAHEAGESTEEETREGAEPEEQMSSRKRSAKNAKRTKAPMDADCGCGAKPGHKCSCDGGCGGGYAKKMDALTPQEYLAACELGIQGRSRSYIRARLDVAERQDKKCGGSGIADNKKCNKGGGVNPLLGAALLTGAAVGGAMAYKHHNSKEEEKKRNSKKFLHLDPTEADSLNPFQKRKIGLNVIGRRVITLTAPSKAAELLGNTSARLTLGRGRDSVYADGFTPDLTQLAL